MSRKLHNVLVLSRSYFPVSIMTWQKAMSLLMSLDEDGVGDSYAEKAAPLDDDLIAWGISDWINMPDIMKEKFACVRTTKMKIPLPEIIHLKTWSRLPDRFVHYSRESVIQRDGLMCGYCGLKLPIKQLTIDHIIPRSKGGKSVWDNVVSACKQCNSIKADRTPEQAGMKLLLKPRKPSWLSLLGKKASIGSIPHSWGRFLNNVESAVSDV